MKTGCLIIHGLKWQDLKVFIGGSLTKGLFTRWNILWNLSPPFTRENPTLYHGKRALSLDQN
jgi:hypothetical protein